MCCESAAGIARHAVQNLISSAGPDEWFGILVMDSDEFPNGRLNLFDAAKGAATDSFVGEFGKPSLHQIQPRPVCRREVDVESGALE